MKSSKNIKKKSLKFGLSLAAVVLAASATGAQIKIGGVEIDGLKRPRPTRDKTRTENASRPEAETNQQAKPEKSSADDPPEWWLNVMVGDIKTAQEEVDAYTRETRMFLVSSASAPWLLRAVSAKAREEFAVDKKINDWRRANAGNRFDAALDALAEAASKKLPGYLPNAKNFAHRDALLERTMKSKLKNATSLGIYNSGLFHAAWIIEKNDDGLPKSRYREAYIWAKDSSDDHAYCHLYGFVVQQDYAGGGTYGATYVYLNTDALFGCPAK